MAAKKKAAAPEAVSTPEKSDASDKKESPKLRKSLDILWGVVRKMIKELEEKYGLDIDRDGKIGSAKVWMLGAIASVCLIAGIALGAAGDVQVYYDGDATWGTAKFVSDLAGDITLTVDDLAILDSVTIAGDFDITGDLTVTGTTELDGTLEVDDDFNIGAGAASTGTVDTYTWDISAAGAGSGFTSFSSTTIGGITEANLVDKTATEAVSGAWTHSADLTVSGAADFTLGAGAACTGTIDTSSWDISGAGAGSGFTSFSSTTIGGITEGNLVDKSAVEAISGAWTHSDDFTVSGAADFVLGAGAACTGAVDTYTWDISAAGAGSGFISFTATTIGGITEANLVDKTATEAISGAWTFSDDLTVSGVADFTLGAGAACTGAVDTYTWDISGAGVVSGLTGISQTGNYITTPTEIANAANATQTVAQAFYVLEPSGIYTQYLANPTAAGQTVLFVNNAATNVMFLDAGNMALSGTATLGENDTLSLKAVTTSKWVETGQVDN